MNRFSRIAYFSVLSLFQSMVLAKSMVYFDNDSLVPIRLHTISLAEPGTEARTGDKLVMPNQKNIEVLNISRKVGSGTHESNFSIAFSPQTDEIASLQKSGTSFDLDDFLWIPIANLHQWSKHGLFGGSIYYNIVYPEEKNNNLREEKRTLFRSRTIKKRGKTYFVKIIAAREEPGGGQNDNIRFTVSLKEMPTKKIESLSPTNSGTPATQTPTISGTAPQASTTPNQSSTPNQEIPVSQSSNPPLTKTTN